MTATCRPARTATPRAPEPWTREERAVLAGLTTPRKIQAFLDTLAYSDDPIYRSPRSVLRDRKAHCMDGALFAAAALRRLGFPPTVIDMRAVNDDDHVIAIFRKDGHFGAVAKSNVVGLRYREPICRSLRELVMTYFNDYFNTVGQKTLREYSALLDLRRFDRLDWTTRDDGLDHIAKALDDIRHFPLMTRRMIANLSEMDPRSVEAGLFGSNPAGLFQPTKARSRRAAH